MIGKHFLDIMMHSRFMGHQSYVLLCTETALSNHPVVIRKIGKKSPIFIVSSFCGAVVKKIWVFSVNINFSNYSGENSYFGKSHRSKEIITINLLMYFKRTCFKIST